MSNVFLALAVIKFESTEIDIQDLKRLFMEREVDDASFIYKLDEIYSTSLLYKLWRLIWKCSPNVYTLDWFFNKIANFNFDINEKITIYGYNSNQWIVEIRTDSGVWIFRPPCVLIRNNSGFTFGMLFFSPDGTQRHKKAKIYYGKKKYNSIN